MRHLSQKEAMISVTTYFHWHFELNSPPELRNILQENDVSTSVLATNNAEMQKLNNDNKRTTFIRNFDTFQNM